MLVLDNTLAGIESLLPLRAGHEVPSKRETGGEVYASGLAVSTSIVCGLALIWPSRFKVQTCALYFRVWAGA